MALPYRCTEVWSLHSVLWCSQIGATEVWSFHSVVCHSQIGHQMLRRSRLVPWEFFSIVEKAYLGLYTIYHITWSIPKAQFFFCWGFHRTWLAREIVEVDLILCCWHCAVDITIRSLMLKTEVMGLNYMGFYGYLETRNQPVGTLSWSLLHIITIHGLRWFGTLIVYIFRSGISSLLSVLTD